MFERVIGDWRSAAVSEIRLIGIAAAALLAAAAALGLLCAALFVFVMDRYDVLNACLAVAAVFFVLTLALFILYVASRRQAGREAMAARAARRSLLADPFIVSTGVQIIQAVGIKRVAALLAVAGTAMVLASKPAARSARRSSRSVG